MSQPPPASSPADERATRKESPPAARASSGFQRIWNGLDIDSATIQLDPAGTISPKRPAPDTSKRNRMAQLPVVQVQGHDPQRQSSPDLLLGQVLGAGGMGLVQSATQLSLGRDVAVKTIKADVPDRGVAAAELVREARIAGRLEHPNILPIYALGQDADGMPLLVMKRVEGTAWRQLLLDDPPWLSADDARTAAQRDSALVKHLLILLQVCNAVGFAHSKGIIHRDLKPENVMVGAFGEVYVLDWGVAAEVGHMDAAGTGIAGTPSWMAPEMVAPTADGLGPHTDVYLLGGLLHALLTGEPRHRGEGLYQVLYAAFHSEPPQYGDEVPKPLAQLAAAATAKEPADRPASAAAFREQIEHFLRHRNSLALATEARARLADADKLVELVLAEDGADRSAANLIGDDTAALIHRLGGEARFGFQQALATWPENPDALAGYQQVCATMARFAIAEGDARTAGHLIAEIAEPPPELVAAWQTLSAARARDADRVQRLSEMEADMDLESGSALRSRLALTVAVVWAIVPLAVGILERQGALQVTFEGYIGSGFFWALFIGVGVWFGRRGMMANRVNRAFVRSLAGAVAAPLLQRLVSWRLGANVHQAMTYDLVLFFLVLLDMAATIDWRLAWGAGVYGVAASVAMAWPQGTLFIMAAANLVALTTVALVWWPRVAQHSRRQRLLAHLREAHECVGTAAWRGLRAAALPVQAVVGHATARTGLAGRASGSAAETGSL